MTAASREMTAARPRLGLRRVSWFNWLLLLFLGFVVIYPVALVVIGGLTDPETGAFTLEHWQRFFSQPGLSDAARNTVALTIVRQGLGMPIAIVISWLLARTDIPFSRQFEFMFWIAFFLPALPVTLGWILLLDPTFGLINTELRNLFGIGPFSIYSFPGIVWVHLVSGSIAVKVMLMTPMFRALDASYEEASRVSGASVIQTLRKIVVPAMAPAITVTLLLSIIHSLQSFEVEAILGTPVRISVFSTQIYNLIRQPRPDFEAAMALSTAVLLVLVPLIILQRWATGRRQYSTLGSQFRSRRMRLRGWRWPAAFILFVVVLLMTVLPVALLVVGTFMRLFGFFELRDPWTLKHWQSVLGDPIFLQSLGNTVMVALATAAAGVTLFTVLAYIVVRSRFRGRAGLDFVSWLPSVFPGIILGVGLIRLFLTFPPFQPIYGTVFILVFALVITALTTGVQLTRTSLAQLGKELEEAARVGGGASIAVFRRVLLPLITPTLLSVAAITFISAARDVSATILLATGETRTLALLQLNYLIEGSYERGAVTGVVVVLLTTGVALIARWLGLRVALRD